MHCGVCVHVVYVCMRVLTSLEVIGSSLSGMTTMVLVLQFDRLTRSTATPSYRNGTTNSVNNG